MFGVVLTVKESRHEKQDLCVFMAEGRILHVCEDDLEVLILFPLSHSYWLVPPSLPS